MNLRALAGIREFDFIYFSLGIVIKQKSNSLYVHTIKPNV